MKNILIAGVAKSGKSYLAKKIRSDKKYNFIYLWITLFLVLSIIFRRLELQVMWL